MHYKLFAKLMERRGEGRSGEKKKEKYYPFLPLPLLHFHLILYFILQ
jgi:hypothetical protein